MKHIVTVAIVAFWAFSVGWLLQREVLLATLPSTDTPDLAEMVPPDTTRDRWMGVYHNELRVGTAYSSVRRVRDEGGQLAGYRVHNLTSFSVAALGPAGHLRLDSRLDVGPDGRARRMAMEMALGPTSLRAEGVAAGDRLELSMQLAGQPAITREIELPPQGISVDDVFLPMPWVAELEPGKPYRRPLLDPQTLQPGEAKVTLTGQEEVELSGEKVFAYVVETVQDDVTLRSWVTPEGEVVKQTSPLGLVFVKEPDTLTRAFKGLFLPEGRRYAFASSNRPVPDPRSVRFMRARLFGLPVAEIDPAPDGSVVFESRRLPPPPVRRGHPNVGLDDDPWLAALCKELRAGDAGSQERNDRVLAWLAGKPVATPDWGAFAAAYPSPLILAERLVTLLEAMTIPARLAFGLVAAGDGFYFHAWAEIATGGDWYPIDPYLGQVELVDATHITLRTGTFEQVLDLARYVGRVRVEVLEVR